MSDVRALVESSAAHLEAGRIEAAETDAREATKRAPESAEAHNALGNVLIRSGKAPEAELSYRTAIGLDSSFYRPYHNLGNILRARNELEEAARMYTLATEKSPTPHRSFGALARVLGRLGKTDEAVSAYQAAITGGETKEHWLALGFLLADAKRFAESAHALANAKRLGASGVPTEIRLAESAIAAGDTRVAEEAWLRARAQMEAAPSDARSAFGPSWMKLAGMALSLKHAGEAVEIAEMVLPNAKPHTPLLREALDIRWRAKLATGDVEGAWEGFERALQDGDSLMAFARAELFDGVPSAAEEIADKTGSLDDLLTETLRRVAAVHAERSDLKFILGKHLLRQGYPCEAGQVLTEGRRLSPRADAILTALSEAKLQQGDHAEAALLQRAALEISPTDPTLLGRELMMLHYSDTASPQELFAKHVAWGNRFERRAAAPLRGRTADKIRVGFVSGDFARHSVCRLILPLFIAHDRSRFEFHAYMTTSVRDYYTEQVIANVHQFHAVHDQPGGDAGLCRRIRDDDLDILIDLSGHTEGNRLGAFALGAAPIQATYLGYPNTTGLEAIDYRVTDARADPEGTDAFAVEELIRLPRTAWCFAVDRVPVTSPRPAAGPVVFGSFNNIAKITPSVVRSWARILRAVDGSKLMLKSGSFREEANCVLWRRAFEMEGVDASRIVLMGFIPADAAHIAIYGDIDIALDPFPYNGTMTTCEALAMGVPVISLVGERHASRVGSSLLTAIGLGELALPSIERYEETAIALALDHDRRRTLRESIQTRFVESELADADGFTRAFQAALEDMSTRGPRSPHPAPSPT